MADFHFGNVGIQLVNPYECSSRHVARPAIQYWQCLIPACLALAAVVCVGWRYPAVVLTPAGFLVAALLLAVSWAVGRVLAGQGFIRWLVVLVSVLLTLAVGQGWVDHEGSELTLWGLACMSMGLFAGAVPPADVEPIEEPTEGFQQ